MEAGSVPHAGCAVSRHSAGFHDGAALRSVQWYPSEWDGKGHADAARVGPLFLVERIESFVLELEAETEWRGLADYRPLQAEGAPRPLSLDFEVMRIFPFSGCLLWGGNPPFRAGGGSFFVETWRLIDAFLGG